MIKCSKCGTELPGTAKFCVNCGQPLVESNEYRPEMEDFTSKKNKKKKPKKGSFKIKLILGLVCLIGVAILGFSGISFLKEKKIIKPTIDLTEFVEVKFEGFDKSGTFERGYPCIDVDKLAKEMNRLDPEFSGYVYSIPREVEIVVYRTLEDGTEEITTGGDLEFNEELIVKLNYDVQDLAYDFPDFKFVGNTLKVNAEVKMQKETDPFKNFNPICIGVSPYGQITTDISRYSKDEKELVGYCYRQYGKFPFDFYINDRIVSTRDYIGVGDKVVVKLNEYGQKSMEQLGAKPAEDNKQKEYVLELKNFEEGAYVSEREKMDEKVLQELQDYAKDYAISYIAKRNLKVKDINYIGNVLATSKQGVGEDKYRPSINFVFELKPEEEQEKPIYLVIKHIAIQERVENYGKEDVLENPGNPEQFFRKDADNFDCDYIEGNDNLRNRFNKNLDHSTYDYEQSVLDLVK